jgi:hypothetical protein
MKKTPYEIEALTNRALTSLDNLQQVEANPFLYTRIKSRMELDKQGEAARYTRLLVSLSAALMLFLCINIASIYLYNRWQGGNNKSAPATVAVGKEFFPQDNTYNY